MFTSDYVYIPGFTQLTLTLSAIFVLCKIYIVHICTIIIYCITMDTNQGAINSVLSFSRFVAITFVLVSLLAISFAISFVSAISLPNLSNSKTYSQR